MIFIEKEIRRELRKHLKRRLKLGNGHCQVTIRRLGKNLFAKKGKGYKYKDDLPNPRQRQIIYRIAMELCEEHGGKRIGNAYDRNRSRGTKASRVYQF